MLPLQKVLWPTDFSEASFKALEPAKELAQQFSAELWVMHVILPISASLLPHEDFKGYEQKQTRYVHSELTRIIRDRIGTDLEVQRVVTSGNPAEEIVQVAEKEHINVIVIATHGESAFHNFVFGSVAERVIRLSSRPVLVIRCPKARQYSH